MSIDVVGIRAFIHSLEIRWLTYIQTRHCLDIPHWELNFDTCCTVLGSKLTRRCVKNATLSILLAAGKTYSVHLKAEYCRLFNIGKRYHLLHSFDNP